MKVKVKCTLYVEVDIPDTCTNVEFYIEENSCPGTGVVGAEIERLIAVHNASGTCWACACQGENKIIEYVKEK